jgi:hypothetical protein
VKVATEKTLRNLVQASIELACIRHNLCFEDAPPLVVEECAVIVDDVWNALNGVDTCAEQIDPALLALRQALGLPT